MSNNYEEIKYSAPPQSRNEAILEATYERKEYTDPPQSRIEDLLLKVKGTIDEDHDAIEDLQEEMDEIK